MTRTHLMSRLPGAVLALVLAAPALAGEAEMETPPPANGTLQIPLPWKSRSISSEPQTPAERQLRDDEDRFNKTVLGGILTGAAIGAGTGAVISILKGDKSKDIRNTAIAGGVAGGVIGGIDGYVTAKKEQAGRQRVRELQAAIDDVRQDNARLQAVIDTSNTVLAEGKQRLAALSGDLAAKRVTTQQAEQARAREEQNIETMKATVARAKETRQRYEQAAAKFTGTPQDRRDLDAEIKRMNQEIAQLENNISEYGRALQVSKA